MKIYDISMNIHKDMMVYKNKAEKKPLIKIRADYETSNHYESHISLDLHTGTHIDAPLHMIKDGDTIENYKLDNFIKKCKVLDFTHLNDKISKKDLMEHDIKKGDFILFKTRNSYDTEFNFEFIYLDKEGAAYLAEKEIIGVGIDALGIERNQKDHETHKYLLGQHIIIIEGLMLKDIKEGEYTLVALPIKIDKVEASLTRAVLIDDLY